MATPPSKSYFHRGGEQPLMGATIPQHFAEIATRFPDHEAVVSLPQQRRLSYRQLAAEVDQVAKGLLAFGFGKGDRVGIWSTNNIQWLVIQMATARIGAILVNINPAYRLRELAYALQHSEVQGLFLIPQFRSSNYVAMLQELIPELKMAKQPVHKTTEYSHKKSSLKNPPLKNKELPFLRHVILYDPADRPAAAGLHAAKSNLESTTIADYPEFTHWFDLIAAGKPISSEQLDTITNGLDCDDAINIQYTSGTTGFPKAVVLSHHNILNNAWFSAQAMHFSEADRLAVAVPFYHCFGMVLANLLCFSVGACLVIPCEHFDPKAVLQAIDKELCTAVHGVPTMFIDELELPEFQHFDLSSLRTGIMAGAPCPAPLMLRVMHDMHCLEILIGYGETEASPLTHLTAIDDTLQRRTETVGHNLPHQEVKIVDVQSRQTVPLCSTGEVCFRGYHIMKGYYNDADATAKAIDQDGWLASGDLGTMDANGYVHIVGRLKEMIIRGGENIYPAEIEELIFTHPKVAQVAIFGVPDERLGEQVIAWIKLHENEKDLTEKDVQEFCRDKISHFKIPQHIKFVDEFPMTVTGKVQKFRMREMAIKGMK
ncbi:MAG: AMP-binding protein [Porticoccus sp.]